MDGDDKQLVVARGKYDKIYKEGQKTVGDDGGRRQLQVELEVEKLFVTVFQVSLCYIYIITKIFICHGRV
jgi:hypothetical protein